MTSIAVKNRVISCFKAGVFLSCSVFYEFVLLIFLLLFFYCLVAEKKLSKSEIFNVLENFCNLQVSEYVA